MSIHYLAVTTMSIHSLVLLQCQLMYATASSGGRQTNAPFLSCPGKCANDPQSQTLSAVLVLLVGWLARRPTNQCQKR